MFFQSDEINFLFFVGQLKCCGVSGPSDWKNSSWYKNSDKSELYPESCCKNRAAKCSASPKKDDIYQDVTMTIISSGADYDKTVTRGKTACGVYTPTEHRNDIISCVNSFGDVRYSELELFDQRYH